METLRIYHFNGTTPTTGATSIGKYLINRYLMKIYIQSSVVLVYLFVVLYSDFVAKWYNLLCLLRRCAAISSISIANNEF